MSSALSDDPLLTPQQVGTLIGLTTGTLANKRALHGQDFLPFIKINSRDCRYRRSAVLAFIGEREAATEQTIREAAARRMGKAAACEAEPVSVPAGNGNFRRRQLHARVVLLRLPQPSFRQTAERPHTH